MAGEDFAKTTNMQLLRSPSRGAGTFGFSLSCFAFSLPVTDPDLFVLRESFIPAFCPRVPESNDYPPHNLFPSSSILFYLSGSEKCSFRKQAFWD